MKASELICYLAEEIAEYGDKEVQLLVNGKFTGDIDLTTIDTLIYVGDAEEINTFLNL